MPSIEQTVRTIVDAPDAKPLQVTQGAIAFENVSFGYKAAGNISY